MFNNIIEDCKPKLVIAQSLDTVDDILMWVFDQMRKRCSEKYSDKQDLFEKITDDRKKAYNRVIVNVVGLQNCKLVAHWFIGSYLQECQRIFK